MKVLVYENRKSGVWMWDASTPEKELAAHLALFKELDGYWQCYGDLQDDEEEDFETETGVHYPTRREEFEVAWYKKAKEGDASAAKSLLDFRNRNGAEYESFEIVPVKDPLA